MIVLLALCQRIEDVLSGKDAEEAPGTIQASIDRITE